MREQRRKPIIGLMGGMCSGKSTVAEEFARYGCAVIDADQIAHEVLLRQDVIDKIVEQFGRDILDSQGGIDRKKLAIVVFHDREKLRSLCDVVHPYAFARVEELLAEYGKRDDVRAIVLDIPLLVEVGLDKRCDKLIFVECDSRRRLERASEMGFLGENQVNVRENFQISLDKKRAIADNTIDNNSDVSELSRQVAEIFTSVIENV